MTRKESQTFHSTYIVADLTGEVKRKDITMDITTTTRNTTAKLYDELNEDAKTVYDYYMKLPAHEQDKARAAIKAAVKINQATPEQITALCARIGISDEPSNYILGLWRKDNEPAFWAACEAVDDITDHKTIDELRAIRAAREGGQR